MTDKKKKITDKENEMTEELKEDKINASICAGFGLFWIIAGVLTAGSGKESVFFALGSILCLWSMVKLGTTQGRMAGNEDNESDSSKGNN